MTERPPNGESESRDSGSGERDDSRLPRERPLTPEGITEEEMAARRQAAGELESELRAKLAKERAAASSDAHAQVEDESISQTARVAVVGGVLGAVALVAFLLLFKGPTYEVTAQFQNASQLVKGNGVAIAGTAVGKVASVDLGDHGEALVKIKIEDKHAPLRRGTQAVIRSQSLSGIANRYVELNLPPGDRAGPPIPSGGSLTMNETVSEVDLDQLFNTFDPKTVKNFKNVITGFAISYDGVGKQTNKGFKYANPLLSTTRRLFGELNSDETALESLIVNGASLTSALDSRAPDISALIHNLNLMMGAIGRQNTELADAVGQLPDFMRLYNTTVVNLRATLDDVDPLVNASKPVAKKLQPFARNLRGFARDAVPTIKDLNQLIRRPGANNDLIELTRLQVPLAQIAVGPVNRNGSSRPGAFPASTQALTDSLPQLAFFRPYVSNEAISGWFDDFGHSGVSDANGGFGRIATTFNAFTFSTPTPTITQIITSVLGGPIPVNTVFNSLLNINRLERCPGSNERNPGDNSTPFTDNGALDCNASEVPTGP
jgi:phospholipid/cholesterol/gamma-HCH transport system substrate-binding protein